MQEKMQISHILIFERKENLIINTSNSVISRAICMEQHERVTFESRSKLRFQKLKVIVFPNVGY